MRNRLAVRRFRAIALPVLLAFLHGCGESLIQSVETGTFAGQHQSGFEFYGFRPCGHTAWSWLEGDVPGNGGAWVRFEGLRYGPGQFGHLGASEYIFVIEKVLETNVDSTGSICS